MDTGGPYLRKEQILGQLITEILWNYELFLHDFIFVTTLKFLFT